MKNVEKFCTKAQITVDQFYGKKLIMRVLDLYWIQELPEGFSPVVNGNLYLDNLKKIPEGFSPVVNGNLYLDSLETISKGFNAMVGGSLYLDGVQLILAKLNLKVAVSLHLNNLKSIPKGFNPTVGESLFLGGLKTLPEFFDPMVGIDVIFNDEKSTKDGFRKPPAIMESRDGKYFSIDGILMERVNKKGKVIEGRTIYGETVWVYGENDIFAHGETLEEAKEDYEFKIAEHEGVDKAVARIKLTQVVTPMDYRIITGACRWGIQDFLQRKGLGDIEEMPLDRVLELTEGEYGYEKFTEVLGL